MNSTPADEAPHPDPGTETGTVNDVKARTLRGGFAKVLSQGLSFIVRIGSLVVLARLLEPAEFGVVAMVGSVTGVFNLLRDAGLSMATVQRATVTEAQLSTLFWVNALVGAVLALASAALAPALVRYGVMLEVETVPDADDVRTILEVVLVQQLRTADEVHQQLVRDRPDRACKRLGAHLAVVLGKPWRQVRQASNSTAVRYQGHRDHAPGDSRQTERAPGRQVPWPL